MKQSISSSESLTLLPFVFSMEASQHGLLLSFNQTQTLNLTCEDDDAAIDGSKRSAVMIMSKENELKKMKSTVDHIVAERRRREKLSQRFIALAAIVPGLKKMDKASVLGEAIEHIKDLKERVKILEDNIKKKSTSSCGKCDYECPISSIENDTTVHNGSASDHKYYLHDIDVKLCENAVLVKIHCENQKGVLASLVSDIEALQFTIKNFSTVHFLGSLLDITLVAQSINQQKELTAPK